MAFRQYPLAILVKLTENYYLGLVEKWATLTHYYGMLLILVAMIIGSSLAAFSSPIGSSVNAGFSGLRLAPQKPGNDAPFSAQSALPSPGVESGKPAQRGSLINLSV